MVQKAGSLPFNTMHGARRLEYRELASQILHKKTIKRDIYHFTTQIKDALTTKKAVSGHFPAYKTPVTYLTDFSGKFIPKRYLSDHRYKAYSLYLSPYRAYALSHITPAILFD